MQLVRWKVEILLEKYLNPFTGFGCMLMDSNSQPWSPDNADARPSFRKPSNDAANRKYRRHSPISGSSSSGGSPKNDRSPSPAFSREDPANVSDARQVRKNDRRELDKDSGRSLSGKGGDSRRHSERSYSSSHDQRRHDDYGRHHRHPDEEERNYKRSSQSYRESRSAVDSRRESEHGRSRDSWRSTDKYSRERLDHEERRGKDRVRESEVLERQKHKDKDSFSDRTTSGRRETNTHDDSRNSDWDGRNRDRGGDREHMKDRMRSFDHKDRGRFSCEGSTGYGKDSSGRENSGSHPKETHKIHSKDYAEQSYDMVEKRKYDDSESGRHKEQENRNSYVSPPNRRDKELKDEHHADGTRRVNVDCDSSAKKLKLAMMDKESGYVKDADERLLASSVKPIQESASKVASEPANSSANEAEAAHDLNAAKVAAMKAAELVNRNLVAGGFMSADQKKKLLWGNKKNTAAEESGNRWDVSLFSDRERQEKFYKLMGAKGDLKTEQNQDNKDGDSLLRAEKQQELQLDLEKQYTAGLRRRDGRTVGLGL